MSSSKTLIVNCGASHVAAAVFSANNGRLTLEALDTRDLRYDGANDDAWLPAVVEALRELSRANSRFRGRAVFILPGYQVFTKPIKVPHVEASKQQQIISFEAQNNMPFPLAEVVWGSQIIADDGIETEVVLIAQKLEQANRFCVGVGMIGFEPVSLQPASLLDYNAYKLVHGGEQEDTVLVNIGARSTNLTFVSSAGFYVRNVNIGGNTFTQMVADGSNKTFAKVEELKVAFYSGQVGPDADDQVIAVMQQKAPDFMKRLSQQITQSIIAYRRTTNRAAPVRILLTGRGGLLHGLPEFLSENQKVSVDYFNPGPVLPLKGVEQSVMDRYYYQISEVVGAAARMVDKDAVGVNLLPEPIRKRLAFEKQRPILIAAGILLALAPAPMLYKYIAEANVVNNEYNSVNTRISTLKNLHANIENLSKQANDTREQISHFENLSNSRGNWIQFFSYLQDQLGKVGDVWLDSLEVERVMPEPPSRTANNTNTQPTPGTAATPPPPPPQPTYRLHIKGRMLLRGYDPKNVDNPVLRNEAGTRINNLIAQFNNIPFVSTVEEGTVRNDFVTDRRMVGFDFWLKIKPEQPL